MADDVRNAVSNIKSQSRNKEQNAKTTVSLLQQLVAMQKTNTRFIKGNGWVVMLDKGSLADSGCDWNESIAQWNEFHRPAALMLARLVLWVYQRLVPQ